MTRNKGYERQEDTAGKITIGKAAAITPFILMLFTLGSFEASEAIKQYFDSKVSKIGDNGSVIKNNISEDKRDFVKNKSRAVKDLVNCRLNGDSTLKTAVYQKILTDASKSINHAGNEYEFYYYVVQGFLEAEKKYGSFDYPAKDYFSNQVLSKMLRRDLAQKAKEINESIPKASGAKKDSLTEGAAIINGFSEIAFDGFIIPAEKATMLVFYSDLLDKGATKQEALAGLLSFYNKLLENKQNYGSAEGYGEDKDELYAKKVEDDMLSFRAKLIAKAAIDQSK